MIPVDSFRLWRRTSSLQSPASILRYEERGISSVQVFLNSHSINVVHVSYANGFELHSVHQEALFKLSNVISILLSSLNFKLRVIVIDNYYLVCFILRLCYYSSNDMQTDLFAVENQFVQHDNTVLWAVTD